MKRILLLGLPLLLTGCPRSQPLEAISNSPAPTVAAAPVAKTKVFTKADYAKVTTGMTYEAMVKAVGEPSKQAGESEVEVMGQKLVTKSYVYSNPDFSNAVFTFQNDKLITKAQFNLK